MLQVRRPLPLLFFAVMCLLLTLAVAGCGRRGREAAKEKIKQSHHAFTADDFVKAAADGDRSLVEAFLQGGIDHNAADSRGLTAVMAAAAAGKTDVVKALLDDNAKPDLATKDGKTALHLAAEADQPDAVRALIEANADVRARDHDGFTALLRAVQADRERVIEVLLATSRDQLARDGQIDRGLAVAAVLGQTKIVGLFLDKGANINATVEDKKDKKTPLMLAAEYGQRETVEFLLSRGADPHLTDKDGANASVIALQKGFPDIAKTLDARIPGGKPAVAANATPTPSPSPSVPPELAAASPTPPLSPEEAREQTWLKEKGVKPADVLKHDTGQDDDKDGFTNDEELAAGTDPNDPNSHPPYHTKLRLRRIDGETFPVVFEGAAGKNTRATLSVREKGSDEARRVEVEVGDRIPGMPYRVEKVRSRNVAEKDTGLPVDVSELTLVNTETKRKTVLVKGMVSNSAEARAVLRLALDNSEVTVKQGEEFALPRDPATRYQVVDVRPTQVVLKIVGTGQTVTVEK